MQFNGFDGFGNGQRDFKQTAQHFKSKKYKWIFILAAVLLVFGFLISPLYHLLMEYWQIQEVNPSYTAIFWKNLCARVLTQSVGFVLIFAVLLIHVFCMKRIAVDKSFSHPVLHKKWPYVLLCLLLALSVGNLAGGSLYNKLLMASGGESFGVTDPLFAQDVGYYIFSRPFYIALTAGGKTLIMLMLLTALFIYFFIFIKQGHRSLRSVLREERPALVHVAVLAVLYYLLMMLTYRFSAENILYAGFGSQNEIFGAGYAEAGIWRRYYQAVPFVIPAAVLLMLVFLKLKKYWAAFGSAMLIPVLFIAASAISAGVDSFVVTPDERNLQSPYIAYNMEATNHAFGLDNVSETEFVPQYSLTQAAVDEDDTWLAGTRIADFGSTLTAYNQLQFLRKYYSFHDVDVAPYELDGKLNVVFLAAREMNQDNLEDSAKSYANLTFRYTHGFGAVASPINRVTSEGQPEFLIRDIPPESTGGMPQITQPRIYYGELTDNYVIVGGDNKELDYSEGVEDIQYTFDGDTGVELSFLKRAAFAWYYRDYRMLFSGSVSRDSKILINRNVLERVKLVAPFFEFDDDPYLVISDEGGLYWVMNAYTTSRDYPYAQPYGNINYLRNSVTAVVNAYTGDVQFYLTDEEDPIARTYRNIYPTLFSSEPIPTGIASHIRVPEYMFKVQSEMYQRYHVKDAGQFYDHADEWDIATEKYQDNEITMEPYYNIMEIDGQDEMVLMLPFVLQGKHNMVGLLVQRNHPDHYGELMLYRLPKNETIYGPLQMENRIDNDPDISREMTLWSQGGSSVIRGNLLVVPYRNTLLYVEPIYITSQNGASLPELKRIVVGYGDSIAMEPTLEASLRKVFAEAQGAPQPETVQPIINDGEVEDLETQIQNLLASYDAFREAAQQNDWSAMGSHMQDLDEQMERLRDREQE